MASKSGSFINKLMLIVSLLLLFVWAIPSTLNYYERIEIYDIKKSELDETRMKHHITQRVEPFIIERFKAESESLFSDIKVEPNIGIEQEYSVTVELDKNKIKKFNSFIETLSLRYLVKIKDNELHFEEKEQLIEITFILETL